MTSAYEDGLAKARKAIAFWTERAKMTDEQFLKEYCDNIRRDIANAIKSNQDFITQQEADMAYVAKYHTDEG